MSTITKTNAQHKHEGTCNVMEAKNIRDRMVNNPGMLDHTGVADTVLSIMSLNSKTYYYEVFLASTLDFVHKHLHCQHR